MNSLKKSVLVLFPALVATACILSNQLSTMAEDNNVSVRHRLESVLLHHGFTGRIESTLEQRLGRRIDKQLADLGRMLFFDTIAGLNNDNNVRAAIHRRMGSATLNRLRSALTITASWDRDAWALAISGARRRSKYRVLPQFDVEFSIWFSIGQSI